MIRASSFGQQGCGRGINFAQLIGQAIALGLDLVVNPQAARKRPSRQRAPL